MNTDVTVREVGPRDGLQIVDTFFPTEQKKAWISAEYEAGVRAMQVCSFVPERVALSLRTLLKSWRIVSRFPVLTSPFSCRISGAPSARSMSTST